MGNGLGSQDEEINRREELQQQRMSRMVESRTVGGSNPDGQGTVATTGASTDDMLARFQGETEMTTKKVKSPRYADVPLYTLEALDMDTLREEVFPVFNFTDTEKEAAGALINNPDLSYSDLAEKTGINGTTISRVAGALEGRTDPNEKQKTILKAARENPDKKEHQISQMLDTGNSYVEYVLRAFRHAEVEVEVPQEDLERVCAECETTLSEGEIEYNDDDEVICEECRSDDEDDPVKRDLEGDDDVTYKYDPKDKTKKETRDGQSLKSLQDKQHLMSILREFDQRLRDLEDNGVDTDVPDAFKGKVSSLESRVDGQESVIGRLEDQLGTLERFVDEELDADASEVSGDLEARIERVEDSLSTHKEAIQEVKEGGTVAAPADLSTEEKRRIVVSLATNDEDELIDRVLEEF